jgi:predicted kinase
MFEEAHSLIRAGRAVILDATFSEPALRRRAEVAAREAGVDFHGVWLEAPSQVLADRIDGRVSDSSDATAETLQLQMARDVGLVSWTRVDSTGPFVDSAEAWVARLKG